MIQKEYSKGIIPLMPESSYYYLINHIMQPSVQQLKPVIFVKKCINIMILPFSINTHIPLIQPLPSKSAAFNSSNGPYIGRHNISLNPMKQLCLKHIQASGLQGFMHYTFAYFIFIEMVSDKARTQCPAYYRRKGNSSDNTIRRTFVADPERVLLIIKKFI